MFISAAVLTVPAVLAVLTVLDVPTVLAVLAFLAKLAVSQHMRYMYMHDMHDMHPMHPLGGLPGGYPWWQLVNRLDISTWQRRVCGHPRARRPTATAELRSSNRSVGKTRLEAAWGLIPSRLLTPPWSGLPYIGVRDCRATMGLGLFSNQLGLFSNQSGRSSSSVDPNNYGSSSVEQYVDFTIKVFTNTATCVASLLFILTN